MRLWRMFAISAVLCLLGVGTYAQEEINSLPRNETLIAENPEGTIKNAGWFNIWAINAGGQSTGLQQLAMDTFWYIDPEKGIDGVWENSLAADKPIYNADFTEMTVKLRRGIYWSDGVEYTADDVVYTVQTHLDNKGLRWSAPIQVNVASISAPDPTTVVFKLKKPNSRFHALFTVRWNAMWIMPKHIFEKVGDPGKFAFDPPVTLGAYKLHSYDTNGKWFIWERRDDWQRTSLGKFGEPGPHYVAYIDPGPPDKRVILQFNHQLDIIHDTSPEGMFTLAKQAGKTSHGWFKGFPYAHPDPTLPAVIFNDQNPLFQNRDVRWALALLIDIKAVSMASYRGAATISAIVFTVSLFAKSQKEAQSYLTPFIFAVIVPSIVALLPGIELNLGLALIPVVNISLVCKEMLSGVWHWDYIAVIFGSTALYATAALAIADRMFRREDVIFRT